MISKPARTTLSTAALAVTLSLGNAGCTSCPAPAASYPNGQPMHDPPSHHHGKRQHHGGQGQHHGGQGQHHGGQGQHHGNHDGPAGHGSGPLVHRFNDDAEGWVKRFEGPERDASQKPAEVVKAMAISPGARVADVGTGTGYFLPYLSAAVGPGGQVIAADIEPGMVRFVKARAAKDKLDNVVPQLVLGDDPLLPNAAVDRILIVNTWHHIPDRIAYAKKLLLALSNSGSLWIIDFKLDAPRGPEKKHRLAPTQITQELSAAGFSVRIDDTTLAHQYIAIGSRVSDASGPASQTALPGSAP